MSEMYRCKHLSSTALTYAKLQNNKECAPKIYTGANILAFKLVHCTKLKTNKSTGVQMQTFQVRNHALKILQLEHIQNCEICKSHMPEMQS